jgi:lipid II:glycine glycyltransferase (peptidoglycan interpeptide bridge formation enzyme)
VADSEDAELLLDGLARMLGDESLAYIELRPLSDSLADVYGRFGYLANSGYWLHTIDLEPELPHLFARFHKDSTQRKIRRAEKEHLSYEEGTSEYLVRRFYVLQLMTRRRQHLPPQPLVWFLNVTRCMGESAKVRLASLGQRPIAGILTLRHKDTVVYKYGASDARFHNLGGVALLFWRTIQEAKSCGIRRFDLGRSDLDNEGLATFKDRWSGARTKLTYWRCSRRENTRQGVEAVRVAQGLLGQMPDWVLAAFGKLLYRHIG